MSSKQRLRPAHTVPITADPETAALQELQSAAKDSEPIAEVAAFVVGETDVLPSAAAWLTVLRETDTVAQVHSGVGVQQFRHVDGQWAVRSYCAVGGRPRTRHLNADTVASRFHPPATLRGPGAWNDDLTAVHASHAVPAATGGEADG